MSEKKPGVVLAFTKPYRKPPEASPAAELRELLAVYDPLIALLRDTEGDGLDLFADSLVKQTVRCREALAAHDDDVCRQLVQELRATLHETPRVLRSLLPGLGPRLGESLEHKLGIQFVKY